MDEQEKKTPIVTGGLDAVGSPYTTEELLAGLVINDKVYNIVEMREITGLEEDLLAEKKGSVTDKISKILASCIRCIKSSDKDAPPIENSIDISKHVKQMAIGDRIYLFVRLRVLSLGNMFNMEFVAPSDGKKFTGRINLDDLELRKLTDMRDREREFVTPKGHKFILRLATGEDEAKLSALDSSKNRATAALMQRMVQLNGEQPTVGMLQKLPMSERNFIREKLEEFDAGVDTVVLAADPNTNEEFEADLGIGQKGFFFPLET
jgi:hypothetical protein